MANTIDVPGLASAYKSLVGVFGIQLILSMIARSASPEVASLLSVGIVLTSLVLAYFGFRTAQALGFGLAWLWAIGMMIPCVNILTLLSLSSRATAACKANGIPVGLLGPKV